MPKASRTINELLRETNEPWMAAHAEAMECLDLQDSIRRGMGYYQQITKMDVSFSEAVIAGVAQFDLEVAKKIESLYNWWLQPCESVFAKIQRFQQAGHKVVGADEFVAAFNECPTRAFDLAGVQEAASQVETAKLTHRKEVTNGLHNRLHAKGPKGS